MCGQARGLNRKTGPSEKIKGILLSDDNGIVAQKDSTDEVRLIIIDLKYFNVVGNINGVMSSTVNRDYAGSNPVLQPSLDNYYK